MRHKKGKNRLNRTSSHLEAMLGNMVTSLFKYERIKTTPQKAKSASALAEKLITKAKKDTLHARREVFKVIKDKDILKKLFETIAPRYKETNGGYTRIAHLANERKGDGSSQVLLDLVNGLIEQKFKEEEAAAAEQAKKAKAKKAAPKKAEAKKEAPKKAEAKKAAPKKAAAKKTTDKKEDK